MEEISREMSQHFVSTTDLWSSINDEAVNLECASKSGNGFYFESEFDAKCRHVPEVSTKATRVFPASKSKR